MEPDGREGHEDGPKPSRYKKTGAPPANWGLAFDLAFRLGIAVILGLGGGLLLDNWLRTSPIFTLIGMVVGIAAAMYTIWDVARGSMRR